MLCQTCREADRRSTSWASSHFVSSFAAEPLRTSQADEVVRGLPNARPDLDAIRTRGSTFYTVEDGRHVIEVEVAAAPVRVSCRFTLCHPASVDNALLGMVHELMTQLGMSVRICDNTAARTCCGVFG